MEIDDYQKIRIAGMWDTLKRYDGYIATVNFRCGLIASFSAAVFGGVLLKADMLMSLSSQKYILALLLVILSLLSLLSIYWVVRSIWPNLSTNTAGDHGPSMIFFGTVAKSFTASEYVDAVRTRSIEDFEVDLAIQVHEVAQITLKKFEVVSKAAKCVKWSLLVMGTIIILVIMDSLGIKLCLL